MSAQPKWSDPPEQRLSVTPTMRRAVPGSNMFTIRDGLTAFKAKYPGRPIYDMSQGDGGASLGGIPLPELCEAYVRFTKSTAYGQPNGDPRLRKVLFENYWKLDSCDYSPEHIVVCDGGRDALAKWFEAIEALNGEIGGTLITSAAPWISYLHGSYLHGLNVLCAPANGFMDYKLTRDVIRACEPELNMVPSNVRAIVITTPDNPTGTYYSANEILESIESAYAIGCRYILVDLMYQLVIDPDIDTYDWRFILSRLEPEVRKCVTLLDGLTKSVGASNVRMAHLVCSDPTVATYIKNHASQTVLPNGFGEAAALEVYSSSNVREHPWVKNITGPTAESRRIVNRELTARGYKFVAGQGYYAFVDVCPWVGNDRFATAQDLGAWLASEHGLAIVHGDPFKEPKKMRLSYAHLPSVTAPGIECFDSALKSLL